MAINEELQIILKASNQTSAAFTSLNKDLNGLKDTAIKVGSALLGAFALRDVINTMDQTVDTVRQLQSVTGLTAQDASRLSFAAKALGVDTDELNTSLGRLAKEMFNTHQNTNAATDVFSKWGIQLKDQQGNIRNINSVLLDAANKIQAMGDSAESRALELDLFGRAGGRMHELLLQGASGISQLTAESDALGLTLNGGALEAMHNFSIQSNIFGQAVDGLKVELGIALLPTLTAVLDGMIKFVSWIRTNIFESKLFAGVMKALGEAFRLVSGFLKELLGNLDRLIARLDEPLLGNLLTLKDILIGFGAIVAATKIYDLAFALVSLGIALAPIAALAVGLALVYEIGAKIMDTVGPWTLLGDAITGVAVGLGALGMGGPWGFIIGAAIQVALTIGLIKDNWDRFVYAWQNGMLNNIPIFGGIVLIAQAIGAAFSAFGTAVRTVFDNVANYISDLVFNAMVKLNQIVMKINEITHMNIPLPGGGGPVPNGGVGEGGDINPYRPHSGGSQDRPATLDDIYAAYTNNHGQMPDYQWASSVLAMGPMWSEVQGLASGGIVTRPMRPLIGEAGPEAVIPLNKSGGWGQTTVNVYVSGNIAESESKLADMVGDRVLRELMSNRGISY